MCHPHISTSFEHFTNKIRLHYPASLTTFTPNKQKQTRPHDRRTARQQDRTTAGLHDCMTAAKGGKTFRP